MKNSNDTIGNRTRDLPACSVVPQLCHHIPQFSVTVILILVSQMLRFFQETVMVSVTIILITGSQRWSNSKIFVQLVMHKSDIRFLQLTVMPQWELGYFHSSYLTYLNVTSQNSVGCMINKRAFHVFTNLLTAPYSSRSSRSHGSHISSVSNAGLPADWNARMWSPFSTVCCLSGTVRLGNLFVFFITYICHWISPHCTHNYVK